MFREKEEHIAKQKFKKLLNSSIAKKSFSLILATTMVVSSFTGWFSGQTLVKADPSIKTIEQVEQEYEAALNGVPSPYNAEVAIGFKDGHNLDDSSPLIDVKQVKDIGNAIELTIGIFVKKGRNIRDAKLEVNLGSQIEIIDTGYNSTNLKDLKVLKPKALPRKDDDAGVVPKITEVLDSLINDKYKGHVAASIGNEKIDVKFKKYSVNYELSDEFDGATNVPLKLKINKSLSDQGYNIENLSDNGWIKSIPMSVNYKFKVKDSETEYSLHREFRKLKFDYIFSDSVASKRDRAVNMWSADRVIVKNISFDKQDKELDFSMLTKENDYIYINGHSIFSDSHFVLLDEISVDFVYDSSYDFLGIYNPENGTLYSSSEIVEEGALRTFEKDGRTYKVQRLLIKKPLALGASKEFPKSSSFYLYSAVKLKKEFIQSPEKQFNIGFANLRIKPRDYKNFIDLNKRYGDNSSSDDPGTFYSLAAPYWNENQEDNIVQNYWKLIGNKITLKENSENYSVSANFPNETSNFSFQNTYFILDRSINGDANPFISLVQTRFNIAQYADDENAKPKELVFKIDQDNPIFTVRGLFIPTYTGNIDSEGKQFRVKKIKYRTTEMTKGDPYREFDFTQNGMPEGLAVSGLNYLNDDVLSLNEGEFLTEVIIPLGRFTKQGVYNDIWGLRMTFWGQPKNPSEFTPPSRVVHSFVPKLVEYAFQDEGLQENKISKDIEKAESDYRITGQVNADSPYLDSLSSFIFDQNKKSRSLKFGEEDSAVFNIKSGESYFFKTETIEKIYLVLPKGVLVKDLSLKSINSEGILSKSFSDNKLQISGDVLIKEDTPDGTKTIYTLDLTKYISDPFERSYGRISVPGKGYIGRNFIVTFSMLNNVKNTGSILNTDVIFVKTAQEDHNIKNDSLRNPFNLDGNSNKIWAVRSANPVKWEFFSNEYVAVDSEIKVVPKNPGSGYVEDPYEKTSEAFRFLNFSENLKVKYTMSNGRNSEIHSTTLYIPVPKKGQYWGDLLQSGTKPFDYGLDVSGVYLGSGSGLEVFETKYATVDLNAYGTGGITKDQLVNIPESVQLNDVPNTNTNLIVIRNKPGKKVSPKAEIPVEVTYLMSEIENENDGKSIEWNTYYAVKYGTTSDSASFAGKGRISKLDITLGKVKALAFNDKNANGIKDSGEEFVDDVEFEIRNKTTGQIINYLPTDTKRKVKLSTGETVFKGLNGNPLQTDVGTEYVIVAKKQGSDERAFTAILSDVNPGKYNPDGSLELYVKSSIAEDSNVPTTLFPITSKKTTATFDVKNSNAATMTQTTVQGFAKEKIQPLEVVTKHGYKFVGWKDKATSRVYTLNQLKNEDYTSIDREFEAVYVKYVKNIKLINDWGISSSSEIPTLTFELSKIGGEKDQKVFSGTKKTDIWSGLALKDPNSSGAEFDYEVSRVEPVGEDKNKFNKFIIQGPVEENEPGGIEITRWDQIFANGLTEIEGEPNTYPYVSGTKVIKYVYSSQEKTEGLGKIERLKYLEEGVEGDSVGSGTKAGYKSEVLSKNTEAEIAEVVKAAEAKNLENRKDQVEKEINKLEYLPEGPVAGDNNDKADFISKVKSPDASLEQVEAALEEAKAKNNTLTGDVKAKVSEANSQIDSVLRDLESGDENTEGTKEYYKKALKEAKTPEKVDEILTAAKEKDFENKKAKLKKAIEDAGLTNQGEKNRLLELVRNATFDVDSAKDRYTEDADKNKGLLFAIESQLKDAINVQAADQLGALKLKYERIKDKLDPSKQSEWDSLSKTLPIDYSALNKILNDGAVKFVNENKSDFEGSLPNLDSLSEGDKNTFTGKLNDMVTGLPQTDLPKDNALHQNTDSYDALVKKVDDVKQAYDALADKHKQALGVAKDAGRKEVTNLAPSGASDILDAINDATKVAEVEKQVAKAKFLKEKEKALEEIANYPNNENKKIKALKAQITAESVSEPPVATKEQFEAAKANVEAKINEAKALNEAIEEAVKVLVEAKKGTTDAVSPEQARELFKDAETAAQVLEVLTGKGVEFKNPTNSIISQVLSGIRDGSISGTEAIEKFKEAIALDKRIEEGKKEIKASGVKDPKKAELLEKVSQANSISDVETDVIEAKANALENLTNATIKSKLDELKAINQKLSEASEDLENAKSALQFATNLDNAIKDGVRALDEINSQTPIEGISEKKVEIRAAQTVKEVLEKLVDSLPDIDGSSVEQMAGLKAIKDSIGSANEEGAKAKLDEAIKLHKAIREGIEAINAIKDLPNKSELKNQIKNLSDPEMIRSLVNETKTAQGLKEAKEALKELVKHKGLTSPTDSDIDGLSSLEEIVKKLKEVAIQPPVDNTVQELVNKIDDIVSDNNKTPTEKSQEVAKESKKIADRVKDIIDAQKAQEKVADTGKAIIDETYPALTNADDVKQQIDNLPNPKDPKAVADIIKNNLPIAKSPIDNAKVNEIFDDINNINTDSTKTPEQKKAEIQAKLEELKELNKGISDEVKKVDEDVQPFKDMSESEKNSIKEKIQKAKTPEEAQEIFNSEKADAVIANTGKVETATPHVKDAIDNLSDLSPLEKEDFKKRIDGTSPYSKPQTVEELNNILEAAKAKNLENKKAKAKSEIEAIMDAVNNIIEPDVDNAKLKELLADIASPATNAEDAAAKIEEAKKLAEAIKDVVTEVKDLGTEYVNPPKSNDLVNKLNVLTDSDTANIKNTVLGPVKDAIVTAEQEKAKDEVEGLKSIAEQPVNTHVQALLDKINNPEGGTPEEKLENVKKALEEAKALDEKINDIVGKLDTDEFKNLTESEKNIIKADIKENSTPDNIAKKINDAVIKNATNSGKVEEAKAAAKKEVQAMEALKAVDPTEHARLLQAIEDATTPEVVKGLLEEARAKNELAKLGADEYNTAKSSIDGITPKPGEAGFDPDAYKNALAEKVLDAAKTKATKDVEAEIAKLPEGVTNDKLNEIKNSIAGLGTPDEVKQKVEEAKALVEALKDAVEKVKALPTTDPTVAVDLDTLKANLNGVSTPEEAEQKMKEAKKAHADAIKAKIEEEIGNLNSTNPGVNAYLDKVKAVNPQVDTADADIQKLKEEFENAKKLDSKIKDLDNILNSPIFNTLTEAQKQAIKDDIKNNAGSLADFDAKIEEAKQAASIAQGKVEEAKAAAKKEVQAMEALKAVDPTEHARLLQAIEDATTPEVVKGLLEEARAKNELAKLGADEYNTAKSSIDGITPKPGEAGFDPDAYKNALAEKVLDAAKTKATKDVEAEIAKLPEGVTNDRLNEIKNSIAGLGTPDEVKQKVEEAKALVEALKDAVEKVKALPTTDPTVAVDLDTLKANLNGVSTPEEAEQKMEEAKKAHAEKVKNKAKSDIEGFGKPNNRGIQEAMELLDDINTNNQSGDESIKQAREILEKAKKLNDVLNKLDEEFETDVFKGLTPEKKTELKNNILTYAKNVEDVAKMLNNAKGNSEGKEETVEEMKEKGPKDIDSMKGLANVSPTESQTLKDKLSNANTIEEAKAVLAEAHAKNVVGSLEDPAKSEALQNVNEAVNKFESSPKNKADVDALNRELAEAVKDAAKAQVDAYLDVAPLNEEPKVTNQRLEEIKAEIADTNTTVEQINAKLEEAKKLADAMKKAVEEQNSLEKEEPMNAELAKKVRDSLKADLANANTLEDVFNKGLKAQQFAEAITKALKKEEEIKATGLDENNEVSNDLLEKLKNATDKAAVEVAIADAKSALTDKAKNKLIELANQVDPAVKPTVLTDKINALQGEPSNVKEGFDEIKAFIEKVKEFEAATIDKLSPEAQEDLKSKVKAAQSEERVKDLIEEAKAKQNALTDFENGADNLDILTDEVKNKWIGEIEKANSAEEANLMLSKAKQEAKFEKGSFEEAKPLTQEIINSLEGLTDKDKQDLVAETEDAATTTKLELKAILEKAKVIAELRKVEPKLDEALIDEIKAQKFEDTGAADNTLEQFKEKLTAAVIEKSKDAIDKANEVNTQNPNDALKAELDKIVPGNNAADVARAIAKANELANKVEKSVDLIKSLHDGYELSDAVKELIKNAVVEDDFNNAVREAAKEEVENVGLVKDEDKQAVKSTVDKLTPKEAVDFVKAIKKGVDSIEEEPLKALRDEQKADLMTNIAGQPNAEAVDNIVEAIKNAMTEINGNNEPYNKLTAHEKRGYLDELVKTNTPELVNALLEKIKKAVAEREEGFNGGYAYGELTQAINSAIDEVNSFENLKPEQKAELIENIKKATTAEEIVKILEEARKLNKEASSDQWPDGLADGIRMQIIDGEKYFYNKEGKLLKGWIKYDGHWYLLSFENGKALKGWNKYYDRWFYLDPKTAKMHTGWLKYNNNWYYLNPENGDMAVNWKKVDGKWYLLDGKNGNMKTGWHQVNGKWYYLNAPNGDMALGWINQNGKWYFLDWHNGDMKTGWKYISGKWYLLNNSGVMLQGWQLSEDKWYFLDKETGEMRTGWIKVDGKWYFLDKYGAMANSDRVVENIARKFATSGEWLGDR